MANRKLPNTQDVRALVSDNANAQPAVHRLVAGLAQASTTAVNIAWFGSSSVAGSNATTPANRFVDRTMVALQQAFPNGGTEKPTVTMGFNPAAGVGLGGKNFGVGGTTSADYYFRSTFGQQITDLQPFAIFHMIGSNDWTNGFTAANYRTNLLAAIADIDTRVTRPHVHVLLHAFRRSDTAAVNSPTTWESYRDVMRSIALDRPNDIAFFDMSPLGDVNFASTTDPLGLMDTDLIHPTNAGHLLYKEGLVRMLDITPAPSAGGSAPAPVVSKNRINSDTFWRATSPVQAISAPSDALLGGVAATPAETAAGAWSVENGVLSIANGFVSMLGYATTIQNLEISAVVKSVPEVGSVIMLNSRRTTLTTGGNGQARVAIDNLICQLEINGTGAAGRVGNVHPWKLGDRIGVRSVGDVHELLINNVAVERRVVQVPTSGFYGVACSTPGATAKWTIDEMMITEL